MFWTWLYFFISFTAAFRQQSFGIRGKLICGHSSAEGITVKLYNDKAIGFNNQLAETRTDGDGNYELTAATDSIFSMEPYLKIYTNCNRGFNPCKREIKLEIPSDYVTRTSTIQQWFDGGIINLQFKFDDEERKCF
ncbi:unnamed protein product [Dracunculus medinensis]|uniref:Transthyretin-like family protein n=1 Tax=Dracunculus medinensis TaxID=318479 RepID=A0A0N4UI08_DRAME|nr:unnamed protein product [Dracunculus medinensis]